MELLARLKRHRDERDAIIQANHRMEHAEDVFKKATQGLKPKDSEYQNSLSELFSEIDDAAAEIAEIETRKMSRRAAYWRVPYPHRPSKEGQSNDFWQWHDIHGRYYISDRGLSQLRREIYQEWEMWWKPWLTWSAITISIVSLVVAALKPQKSNQVILKAIPSTSDFLDR